MIGALTGAAGICLLLIAPALAEMLAEKFGW